MAWFAITLTDDEQRVVNAERDSHPDAHVRRKMLALWLLHHGDTRERAATITGLGRATVQRYVRAYRDGGLGGLRRWGVVGPVSALAAHAAAIRESLTTNPVRTLAEAADRIEQLTGIHRKPTQTRVFLAGLGFTYTRVRAIPIPPKKLWPSTSQHSASSSTPS